MYTLFRTILNMSITAGGVVLLILFIHLFLRKKPKIFSYLLWSALLFRLVCPIAFQSPFSLLPVNTETIPFDIVDTSMPRINSGSILLDSTVNFLLPETGNWFVHSEIMRILGIVLPILWLIGTVGMLIYGVFSAQRLKRHLKHAVPIDQNIYQTEHFTVPFIFGLFRPKIFLPSDLSEEESAYILPHEQIHIKRKDHIIKYISYLLLCLHWFNPLIWLAFRLAEQDMECACDEAVLEGKNEYEKKRYTRLLLSFAVEKKTKDKLTLAFAEGRVKDRIKNALYYKKPSLKTVCLCSVLVFLLCCGMFTNPRQIAFFEGDPDVINVQIKEIDGSSMLIAEMEEGTIISDLCFVNLTEDAVLWNKYGIRIPLFCLREGDQLRVKVGLVNASYPAQTQLTYMQKISSFI